MITIAGYLILGLSFVSAALVVHYGRDRLASLVFSYLIVYEFLLWGLKLLGRYDDVPYMSLAIVIDCCWFYFFVGHKVWSRFAVAFSALYGGVTLALLLLGHENADKAYGLVGLAVSAVLLIEGMYRGFRYRHTSADSGWNLFGPIGERFGKSTKGAKG